MKKKNKILIIGGTGFIGYHLAKKCLEQKWEVASISTKSPLKKRYIKNIKYIICDISKKNSIKNKIKEDFDFVINLGGYVDHKNIKKTYASHYIGLKNLANFFLKKNIKLFIQIGTGGEYGKILSPHREGNEKIPKTIYNKSKYLATQHLSNLSKRKNFQQLF